MRSDARTEPCARQVPQQQRAVIAAGGEQESIGGDVEAAHGGGVAVVAEHADTLGLEHVPHADARVV